MIESSCDVVILGAGLAGLGAAAELARRGLSVVVLEARDRIGGRIFTVRPPEWRVPVELGAEFVHGGNRPLRKLIRRGRLDLDPIPGDHWWADGSGLWRIDDVGKRIATVTKRIDERRIGNRSFADFIQDQGDTLEPIDRDLACGFVEGFEAAPQDEMSARAMAGETLDTSAQHVLRGGQDRLVDVLASDLRERGVDVHCGTLATSIAWRRGHVDVRVRTSGAKRTSFPAAAAIVTLPLGVLQAAPPAIGALRFEPALRRKQDVIDRMRMGHVIRIAIRFDARAWRRLLPRALREAAARGFGFVQSRTEDVPVWWSLRRTNVVTGWAGGPAATALERSSRRVVIGRAVASLARLLDVPVTSLRRAMIDARTHDWTRDPFSRGAYSFIVAGHDDDAAHLAEPVQDTLFFAGEATAHGAEIGTVHGALASGIRAAKTVAAGLAR